MNQLFDLTGQVAMVTGASRGLGQHFARVLGDAGAIFVVYFGIRDSIL
jgi:gluconate 5-dehydrogenase